MLFFRPRARSRTEPVPRAPTLSSRIDDIAQDLKDHIAEDHRSFAKMEILLRNVQAGQAPHTPTADQ